MAAAAVQNPPAESKSAKKKKAKAEAGTSGSISLPAVPDLNGKEDSSLDAKGEGDATFEHPYVKELTKHIRNAQKKLNGLQKLETIVKENKGTSLDDLVAARKINADQKASLLKKPQLESQLAAYEEQAAQYRKFDAEYQTQLAKQKEELTAQHKEELEALKAGQSTQPAPSTNNGLEVRSKLLILSKFLRLAAEMRSDDSEYQNTEMSRAFEGALLGVYGGDEKAVDFALQLIEGIDEIVPNTEGHPTEITCKYPKVGDRARAPCAVTCTTSVSSKLIANSSTVSQVKQLSVEHAPYQSEEKWVDSVAEANAQAAETDPTIAHAGLTELDAQGQANGMATAPLDAVRSPPQAGAGDEAGNAAGDRWDTQAAGQGVKESNDTLVIPRPADEVDTPAPSALPVEALMETSGNSWADETPAYDKHPAENVKAAVASGEPQVDTTWASATEPAQPLSAGGWADTSDTAAGAGQEDGDGFHQVPGRHRGRGGRGRGDGEFRGRGRGRGGFRGDGEFRGRGRGGFRGGRGDGEFRGGRGGRGRGDGEGRGRGGPRGGPEAVVRAS